MEHACSVCVGQLSTFLFTVSHCILSTSLPSLLSPPLPSLPTRSADVLYSLAVSRSVPKLDTLYPSLVEARRSLALYQHHDGITGTAKDAVVLDYGNK